MTHLDPSSLARYNSLTDPHLQSYFSNDRIRSHLKHAGLITGQGEIIPDGEYRTRLARREHRKHVRNMLAENIVNRAIDMERVRHAEMKHQYDLVAKAALVNNIKESRRRSGQCSVPLTGSNDMTLLSIDSCWAQMRSHSANQRNNEISIDQFPISRVKSAHAEGDDYQRKWSSKSRTRRRRRRQSRLRSKSPSASTKNLQSSVSAQTPCEIRMIYYGPKMKIDYDHLVFEPVDEVVIMQQHCGGESIILYKDHLKPGAEFTFQSRRHLDFPFGLTLYVKGYIDSRISTCCEYKHRHGVRLGGERGHFAIISVKGSKPCVKCRFEKQARMKKYAETAKDKDDKNPIIIPVPIADEPKEKQEPVIIPVRSTSNTNQNYADDFDGSDRQKRSARDGFSTDSSIKRSNREERKSTAPPQVTKRTSAIARKEVSRRSSTTSEDYTSREKTKKKTWQIVFHASNAPNARNLALKFSLRSNDGETQTGIHEINMTQFNKHFKSDQQYSFPVQFEDIGQPEQIRLKMERIKKKNDDDDDDDDENVQWQLDQIELIDPESQSHSIFPCRQLIEVSAEKILRLSSKTSRSKPKSRRSSSSSDSSLKSPPKVIGKMQKSSSSSSSNDSPPKPPPKVTGKMQKSSSSSSSSSTPKQSPTAARVMSPSVQSDRSTKSSHSTDRENLVHYRVTIYPSYEPDGNFEPTRSSRIYLRVNSETKSTDLPGKLCPRFKAGERQTFELYLRQTNQDKPKKLTIGYLNQNEQASTWKLDKIVLVNIKTGVETIFPCQEALQRDASNYRAEKTFENQSSDDDQSTPRNEEIDTPKSNHFEQPRPAERSIQHKPTKWSDEEEEQQSNRKSQPSAGRTTTDVETPKENQRRSPSIHSTNEDITPKTPQTNVKIKERSSSFENPNDELGLGSKPSSPTAPRPKTRRGRDEPNTQPPVAPLVGLEGLGDHTGRSDRQKNPISSTSTITNTTENQSRRILSTNRHDGDAEDN